jgi:hypothetical protein
MTFISANTPTASKIVIAGDRRLTGETGKHSEILKIIQLGEFAVGAITGVPRLDSAETGKPVFDAFAVLQEVLGEGVDGNMMAQLALIMTDRFSEYQEKHKANFAKPASTMQVVLFTASIIDLNRAWHRSGGQFA